MEQMICTWSGAGIDGPGMGPAAASAGLRRLTYTLRDTLRRVWTYRLPASGLDPALSQQDMPLSFALMMHEGQRVLVHRAYLGLDAYYRPGNYIAHVLADVPDAISAEQAVLLWESPFWQRTPDLPPPGAVLPLVTANDLAPGPLAAPTFARSWRALRYLISAFLTREPGQRMIIAAPPDLVAELLAGLTAALPAGMLRRFTFSTFELDPLAVDTTVTGTGPIPLAATSTFLFADTWKKGTVWIDAYTNTHATVRESAQADPYAAFAVACLTGASWQGPRGAARQMSRADLRECLAGVIPPNSEDAADLLRAFALYALESEPTAEELAMFLGPAHADRLTRMPMRRAFIQAAVQEEGGRWWQRTARIKVEYLRVAGPPTLDEQQMRTVRRALRDLAAEAAQAAVRAGYEGDVHALATLTDVIVVAAPEHAAAYRRTLVESLAAHAATLTTGVAGWTVGAAIELDLSAEAPELAPLLARTNLAQLTGSWPRGHNPDPWIAVILRRHLETGGALDSVVVHSLLLQHENAVVLAVRGLAAVATGQRLAISLLRAAFRGHPAGVEAALHIIGRSARVEESPAGWYERVIGLVLNSSAIEPAQVFTFIEKTPDLIDHPETPGLMDTLKRYLTALTAERASRYPAHGLLVRLIDLHGLPVELAHLTRAWLDIGTAMYQSPDALDWKQVGDALDQLSEPSRTTAAEQLARGLIPRIRQRNTLRKMADTLCAHADGNRVLHTLLSNAINLTALPSAVAHDVATLLERLDQTAYDDLYKREQLNRLAQFVREPEAFFQIIDSFGYLDGDERYRIMGHFYAAHRKQPAGPVAAITQAVVAAARAAGATNAIAQRLADEIGQQQHQTQHSWARISTETQYFTSPDDRE